MQSCLIVAGEKSGEEHALSFFSELKSKNPDVHFFGVGGDDLVHQGVELLYHLNDFSSFGYSEVIHKIPFYKKAMDRLMEEVIRRNCQVAILIDFQSFNLKLAGKLKELGVEVLYYVAPQAWVWKEYRVKKLAKSVHTLFSLIPFEKKWFSDRGVSKIISIDHPQLTLHRKELENYSRVPMNNKHLKILILPGSRNFEVSQLLGEFINAINLFKKQNPNLQLSLGLVKSSSVKKESYDGFEEYFNTVFTNDELVSALKWGDLAIAASGTVTLSCALFELPTIVCYRVSFFNYLIYEVFISYTGPASLANIVHNRSVFPELIQERMSAFNIASYLNLWYYNQDEYLKILRELSLTKSLVKGEGVNVADYMSSVIKSAHEKKENIIN